MRYLQEAQGRRRDVRVLPVGVLSFAWFRPVAARHMPDVRLPDTPFTFRALLDANAGRPIFVCNRVPWLQTLEDGYALWRAGLVEEVLAALVAAAEASFVRLDPAAAFAFPAGSWEHGIGLAYWTAYERLGLAVARLASARAASHAVSVRVFQTLARHDPSPPPARISASPTIVCRSRGRTRWRRW